MRKYEIAAALYEAGYSYGHIARVLYGRDGLRERKRVSDFIRYFRRKTRKNQEFREIYNYSYYNYINRYDMEYPVLTGESHEIYSEHEEKIRRNILFFTSLIFPDERMNIMYEAFRLLKNIKFPAHSETVYLAAAYIALREVLMRYHAFEAVEKLDAILRTIIHPDERFIRYASEVQKRILGNFLIDFSR